MPMQQSLCFLVLFLLSLLPVLALAQGRSQVPSIPLTWDYTLPLPDTFLIERRLGTETSAESWILVATVPGTELAWEDTTAEPATPYCWQVRAVIAVTGVAEPTNLFCVRVSSQTPPATNLRGAVKRQPRDGAGPGRP